MILFDHGEDTVKKPTTVRATGLGHPEGPYELDDGRVIFANTYGRVILAGARSA